MDGHEYKAPSGNSLNIVVLSAEQVTTEQAKVSVCYELPTRGDWVLGRLFNDVNLSDDSGSAPLDHLELLALSESPPKRCDRLFFSRPGGFPIGNYLLTIARLAATIPEHPDWPALQRRIAQAAPGIVIEPLAGQSGLSFALLAKPEGMTDPEAHDIVVGLADRVLIGPWSIPIEILRSPPPSPSPTLTPPAPTRRPTETPLPTRKPSPTLACNSDFAFKIPTPIATADPSSAFDPARYIYAMIPPLPPGVTQLHELVYPYGELSAPVVPYTFLLMERGGQLMLWLAIPFAPEDCCTYVNHYRVYDAVVIPPQEPGARLVPFFCSRGPSQGSDPSLIAVTGDFAELGDTTTQVQYAWRIDRSTTTLKEVATTGLECGCSP